MEEIGPTVTSPQPDYEEQVEDLHVLKQVLMKPARARADVVRRNIEAILRLVEQGCLTTVCPSTGNYGQTLYVTIEGARRVWL